MKNQWRGFIVGIIFTLFLTSMVGTAFAAYQKQATLNYNGIRITIDGEIITPRNTDGTLIEPFIIDGTTYLPIRAIAEALGLGVKWDGQTQTVILSTEKGSEKQESSPSKTLRYYENSDVPMLENIISASYIRSSETIEGIYLYQYAIKDLPTIIDPDEYTFLDEYHDLLLEQGFKNTTPPVDGAVNMENSLGHTVLIKVTTPGQYFDDYYLNITVTVR